MRATHCSLCEKLYCAIPGILFLLCFLQTATPAQVPPPLNTLTQAVQVLNLTPKDAQQNYPVSLRGVVTCAQQASSLFFIQDATAGIYIYFSDFPSGVKTGDYIEVEGKSNAGLFSPIVQWATLKRLGTTNLPAPKRVAIEKLASGSEDSQWVEIEGVVHKVNKTWDPLVLDLVSGSTHLDLWILQVPPKFERDLSDARVRVQGVVGVKLNSLRQPIGVHLYVPDIAQLQVLEPPNSDPFSAPVQPCRSLMLYSPKGAYEHRVHLRGGVTWQSPGKSLIIRDDSGSIQVYSSQTSHVAIGATVDVVGFAARGGHRPTLVDASFRENGRQQLPKPAKITATQALSGEFDNELVLMEGTVIAEDEAYSNPPALVIQSDKTVFRAHFPPVSDQASFVSFPSGSEVKVTGICAAKPADDTMPQHFSVWLRSADDIVLTRLPSPWTRERVGWILAVVAALFLCGFLWLFLLKKQVRRQTETLRKREGLLEKRYQDLFENANDIIVTCDLTGRITSINKTGEQRFGYMRGEILKMNLADLATPEHRHLVQQHLDAGIAGKQQVPYEAEVMARNGNLILEIMSRPDLQDGQVVGVQCIARDITARKEAEMALRQSEQQLRKSLQERERIGRDLHDGIIQSIYAVGLNVEDCKTTIEKQPEEAKNRLAKILSDMNSVIREVRNFIVGIESGSIEGSELKSALKSLILTLGESHASHFSLNIDPFAAESLTPKQATHLLHIAREGISNSVRHARAEKTTITLEMRGGSVRFEIADDGIGFDKDVTRPEGHGLRNINARACDLTATLSITSKSGFGTRIMLDIPLKKSQEWGSDETH